MKAEHRHELRTNVLADRMGRIFETMKSPGQQSSVLAWTMIGLVVVVIVTWQVLASSAASSNAVLWAKNNAATHDDQTKMFDDLVALAENNHGTLAGRTSRFEAARYLFDMSEGATTSQNRADSVSRLSM